MKPRLYGFLQDMSLATVADITACYHVLHIENEQFVACYCEHMVS